MEKSHGKFKIENASWRDLMALNALEKLCFNQDAWPLLELLGVLPDWRRKGIAEALLKECERRMGMHTVKLTVRRGNRAAIGLYEKMGYKQIAIWPKYYRNGEDGMVLEQKFGEMP